ncbi:MAG: hypothetical protein ACR2HX_07420 [Pyrinomonadaceae bacterium]
MIGDDLSKSVRNAIFRASKPWRVEKKKTKRKQRFLSPSAVRRLYGKHGELSIKAAAYQVMERAYMQASVNNTLPANARQVMYQARPLVLKLTGGRIWANSQDFHPETPPELYKGEPCIDG